MEHPPVQQIVDCAAGGGLAEVRAHLERCGACRDLLALCGGAPAGPPQATAPPGYSDPREIHRGGMGRIIRAHDARLGRDVALKQLLEPAAYRGAMARSDLARRLRREARLTARLQHPAIVGVYEVGSTEDGEPYYAMPLLRGEPLSGMIASRAALSARLGLLANVAAACDALAYAHAQGIVHRDLKPENILVGQFGETVVVDWGLARDLHSAMDVPPDGEDSGAGLTGLGVGTAAYMPVEQALGRPPDPRADVYALGATLYHVLAGASPYADAPSERVRARLIEAGPRPIDEVAPDAPAELYDIVGKAMARDAAHRFTDAGELAEELRRYLAGQLTRTRQHTAWEVLRHFYRRNRAAVLAGALGLAMAATLTAIGVIAIRRERDDAASSERRALVELQRSRGVEASLLSRDPGKRLDAIVRGVLAVGPSLASGEAVPREARAGLLDALSAGPAAVELLGHRGRSRAAVADGGRTILISSAGVVRVWRGGRGTPVSEIDTGLDEVLQLHGSPDGRRALALGQGKAAVVISPEGNRMMRLEGADQPRGAWLDDKRAATIGFQGAATVWDVATGTAVARLQHDRGFSAIAAHGGRLALGDRDGRIVVWDPMATARTVLSRHRAEIVGIRFLPDGRLLTAAADGSVALGAPDSDRVDTLLSDPSRRLLALWVSPDSLRFAVGFYGGGILTAPISTPERAVVVSGGDPVNDAQPFSPDGQLLATAREDGGVRLWNTRTGRYVTGFFGHRERGGSIHVLADGRVLSAGRTAAFLWDGRVGAETGALEPHASEVVLAEVSAGGMLATAGLDGRARIRDVSSGRSVLDRQLEDAVVAARLSPDGARLALATVAGDVYVIDPHASGDRVHRRAHDGAVATVAFSADAKLLVSAGADGVARVWRAADGAPAAQLAHGAPLSSAAFSPDGRRAVTAGADGVCRIWNLGDPLATPIALRLRQSEPLTSAFFSPDGAAVLIGGATASDLWSADGAARVATVRGRAASAMFSPFGPDGSLVTVVADGSVIVSRADGTRARTLLGHRSLVVSATFSGSHDLATASLDGTARRFRVDTGEELDVVRGASPATFAQVTPDARWLVSAFADGSVRVDPLVPETAMLRACAVLGLFGALDSAPYCSGVTKRSRNRIRPRRPR